MSNFITHSAQSRIKEIPIVPYLILSFRRETPDTKAEEQEQRFHIVHPGTAEVQVYLASTRIRPSHLPENDVSFSVVEELIMTYMADAFSEYWSVTPGVAQRYDDYYNQSALTRKLMEKIGIEHFISSWEIEELVENLWEQLFPKETTLSSRLESHNNRWSGPR